ncbi:ATP-binding mismatch repair protein [Terramyces sp. JEL0728]|nr:ATP-binding mismatch repair protein [Terramyces sp. JEL0728]
MISRINKQTHQIISSSQVITSLSQAIKELVENSIDANSTRIDIKIGDTIQVIDDGDGINIENHELLGRKSFTSKLSLFSDLEIISSFGFRGEAIHALCQLSDLTVVTSTSPPIGYILKYTSDGELKSSAISHRKRGTTIQIDNLFLRYPVRYQEYKRNFKKELQKCIAMLYSYCICVPHVRFSCTSTKKEFETGGKGIKSVLDDLFGSKFCIGLIDFKSSILESPTAEVETLELHEPKKVISFHGYISGPKKGRADTDRQYVFVNNKPMVFPKLLRKLNEIYKDINLNQYPIVILLIDIPLDMMDRNVTPDKQTVLFEDEGKIVADISEYVRGLYTPFKNSFVKKDTSKQVVVVPKKRSFDFESGYLKMLYPMKSKKVGCDVPEIKDSQFSDASQSGKSTLPSQFEISTFVPEPFVIEKQDFKEMQIIGQFNKGFILASLRNHLFIVDQHASDEKFNYERLKSTSATIQPLFNPVRLELTPVQQDLIVRYQQELKTLGFDFRANQLVGVPVIKDSSQDASDLYEILNNLEQGVLKPSKKFLDYCASKACRYSVMIGDDLDMKKMKNIVTNMGTMDQPWNCPHGRPTMRLLSKILPAANNEHSTDSFSSALQTDS